MQVDHAYQILKEQQKLWLKAFQNITYRSRNCDLPLALATSLPSASSLWVPEWISNIIFLSKKPFNGTPKQYVHCQRNKNMISKHQILLRMPILSFISKCIILEKLVIYFNSFHLLLFHTLYLPPLNICPNLRQLFFKFYFF